MRERVQAVATDRSTTIPELWHLRDAGRDTYTPAQDAPCELLPAEDRLNDVHAGYDADDADPGRGARWPGRGCPRGPSGAHRNDWCGEVCSGAMVRRCSPPGGELSAAQPDAVPEPGDPEVPDVGAALGS